MKITSGQRIDEFEILSRLGSGAAGTVFLSEARESVGNLVRRGTRYALKIYNEWVLSEPDQRERISRELLASERALHPNLVRVIATRIDYGPSRSTYAVMELVPGRPLDEFVRENYPLSPDVIESIFTQLMEAILALHKACLIHRDIKPQNIMIDGSHVVKLMDLGVVKCESESTITKSDQFVGTIRYSAPEMLFGETYNNAVDIYSAGAVLYFLLTGQEPFSEQTMFSNLIVKKRERPRLSVNHGLRQELPTRTRILATLASAMTEEKSGWHGGRIASANAALDILTHMEMSDWWIGHCVSKPSHFSDFTPRFKTLVIRYLDPKMPKSRSNRLELLRHLIPADIQREFLDYLMSIEDAEGETELQEIIKSLEDDDDFSEESGD